MYETRTTNSLLSRSLETTDPATYLRGPCTKDFEMDHHVRKKVISYLEHTLQVPKSYAKLAVPDTVVKWGNVRIDGGDRIRTEFAQHDREGLRDASYVRVCILCTISAKAKHLIHSIWFSLMSTRIGM